MTATTGTLAGAGAPPRLVSLFRAELERARSRRSLPWLTVVAVVAVVSVATLMWFNTAHVTADDMAAASVRYVADQQQYHDRCMADPSIPEDQRVFVCGQPASAGDLGNAIWYLPHAPFSQSDLEGLLAFGGGVGMLVCLMLAATTGGADWGARTIGLLLSWEPRRTRVLLVRLVVVIAVGVLVEVLVVGLALGLGILIGESHYLEPAMAAAVGDSAYQPVDPADAAQLAVRWIPLAALAAAGSFAMAMLTRSTGWAVGATIGFVAVVESVVQGLWAWGSQWLIQTNISAWLQGGIPKRVDRRAAEQSVGGMPGAGPSDGETEAALGPGYIFISDTRALATLAGLVIVLSLASWASFRFRDVE